MKTPLVEENERLRQWIADLQSGMYINCVYCGHRYGPDPGTPVAMADVLKAHIEVCPEHPASKLKEDNAQLREALERNRQGLLNILEFRKLSSEQWGQRDGYGGRYGALTREEIEGVIAEIDATLAATQLSVPGQDDGPRTQKEGVS